MANTELKIKMLKDSKGANFLPFSTSKAVFIDGTDKTVDSKLTEIEAAIPTKTSDLTNDSNFAVDANYVHTDNNYTTDEKTKLSGIETGAEVNTIESIEVNGIAATIDGNKKASVTIETGAIDTISLNNTPLTIDANKNVDIPLVTTSADGAMSSTDKIKLNGIENGAQVNVIETVKVNGSALTPENKAVDVIIPAAVEYTIAEVTATTGYAKSYQLKKDNAFIGAKIDIPKDLVVSSGEVKTVITQDVPYIGAQVGDKYIDLTLNDPNQNHIYIPVNDLVDAYTAGNGIDLSNTNVISTKIDTTNANGLSVGVNGVALAVATTSAAGAMSAADKTKLDTIESNADVNTIESISVNNTSQTIDVNKNVDITVPTKTSDLTNDSNFVADANYVHTDNNYTNNEKTKLSGIETGAQVNTIETVKVNGTALTPDANKAVDITVSPSQYDTMPTPAAAIEGKIVQYVGDTTTVAPIYTNGLFYKCVEDSETPGTYIWENISVIDDYVIAEDIQGQTSISGITILPADNSITYNMFTSDVKGRFVETFSGTTNPSSSLGKDGDVYFLVD